MRMRVGPAVYFFAALALLSVLAAALYFRTIDIFVALGCALIADVYVFTHQSRAQKEIRYRKQGFPILFVIIIFAPIWFGEVLAFEGFLGNHFEALARILLMTGFTVTFFFITFSIPLAILFKWRESKIVSDPNYRPFVSVLVPAYNEEKVIARTLNTLVNTKYANKEIIVIDDGSTDKTYEIASQFTKIKDYGVKVFRKENHGKSAALNFGLVLARGSIIVTVDADTMVTRGAIDEFVSIMSDRRVAAVAGNICVLSPKSTLASLQKLEYIININIMRRALDLFNGSVMVVPGAFGAFRKSAIQNTGGYDKDTLAEDFDLTVKMLKSHGQVKACSKAVAYTEVPLTVNELYRQRRRWGKGMYQTMFKHKDVFSNERYGHLRTIVFPTLLLTFLMPFAGFLSLGAGILTLLEGNVIIFTQMLLLFGLIQLFVVLLSVALSDGTGSYSLAVYAPFFVLGYKQLLDYITIVCMMQVEFGIGKGWIKTKRIGGGLPAIASPSSIKR